MFNIQIPKNHFLLTEYPEMEEYILGQPIPIGWGDIRRIVPYCVDVDALRFKILGQPLQDITEVRSAGLVLGAGSYVEDLPNAEITLAGTPYLVAGFTYYLIIDGSYPINGTDYLILSKGPAPVGWGQWEFDGVMWLQNLTGALRINLYGKQYLDSEEQLMLIGIHSPQVGELALRDHADRTRIALQFQVYSAGFYLTRATITLAHHVGDPAGDLSAIVATSLVPVVQKGMQSGAVTIEMDPVQYDIPFAQDGEDSDLQVDVLAPNPVLTNGADILEDMFVSILGKPAGILDVATLADFRTKRTQEIKIFIDREMTVGEFIGKLEGSLFWKFLPLQDGTYAPTVFEAGEPAGTLHLRDEDIDDFKVEHDLKTVRNLVRLKYNEDPSTQEFQIAEARSDYARLFYSNEETAEVETWLVKEIDAESVCEAYRRFFQQPEKRVSFWVHGYGLNLLPGRDKVKLWRSRAGWSGGKIEGELFRIMRLEKSPSTNRTKITAVPDAMTIPNFTSVDSASASVPPVPPITYGDQLYYTHGDDKDVAFVDLSDYTNDGKVTVSSGDGVMSYPHGLCRDATHFYVADDTSDRIVKFLIADGSFVAESGPGVVNRPWTVCELDGYLYVTCLIWCKVVKLRAVDLVKVDEFGDIGTGDDEFSGPRGLCTDGQHLYIGDYNNHRIKKHTLNGGFVAEIGSNGILPNQFNGPIAVEADENYIYVADYGNHRTTKRLSSDLSLVDTYMMALRSGQRGSPSSLAINEDYIYIGCNHSVPEDGYFEKVDKATLTWQDFYDASSLAGGRPDVCWGAFIRKIFA